MALWTGLGQAATVAQLVGVDVGGLISMIMQKAVTARQNRKECEKLARRVLEIAQLLPHVQDLEAAQQLAGLGDTLREAHELVVACQGRSAAYQFFMAGRQAEKFREVQSKIEFYLILFPVISHISITRRFDQLYNLFAHGNSTRAEPSQLPQSSRLQNSAEVGQEVVPHGTQEFTLAEIMPATNNFSPDNLIGKGGFGMVYRGRLHDGREVAVKRMNNIQSSNLLEEFRTELDILPRLRHKHIIRLVGSCVTLRKDQGLQATTLKERKGLLKKWRKEPEKQDEPEELERLIVYEYMENGTLFDNLLSDHGSSELSPVTLSWEMRINVLLGISRAMEHLHCHANPPIIHRDIKSANILFDANWVPHLSDFGSSVTWDMANEESGLEDSRIVGTIGYIAPEYFLKGRLNLASDVYNFGMVMCEVLTGKKAYSRGETFGDFPIVPDYLDKRPVLEPTSWKQDQALKLVAWTARRCVKLNAKHRLAISEVVANLEEAHKVICGDEPAIDGPGVWELGARISSSSSASSTSDEPDLEPEVLDEAMRGIDTNP